ncbi:hydrogenase maturation protease [Streptomyces sp. TRM66268-LWL]|uniref:Hydrogenase maturation protease n=1 Tax=Streptomyces polyasparticus TaxID=2767826 RepID=A0ABR7SFF7_9ACTN|nr:hydrogenase maturation protease [Streptomyces polyasparticus]MBC9713929.1 hydrogenase maturation protease [Streptomyces polyasparticus]
MVAGVGNVFLRDDGFGVEVVRRLASVPLPEGTRVADFGIRGVHLAHELMNGYEGLVLVDALPSGHPPGTVCLLDPELPGPEERMPGLGPPVDAHDMGPEAVLCLIRQLGVRVPWMRVVGCEPADLGEGMGLSPAVDGAVDEAVRLVRNLLGEASVRAEDCDPEEEKEAKGRA